MAYLAAVLKDDYQHSLEKMPSDSVMSLFSELVKLRIRGSKFFQRTCRQRKTCHAGGRSAFGGKLSAVRLPACAGASVGRRRPSVRPLAGFRGGSLPRP